MAETHATAGFPVRLVAWFLDWLLLAAVDAAVLTALGSVSLRPEPDSWGAIAVPTLTGLVYFGYFFSTSGQTPGKRLLGLRVVRADGKPLRWSTGLLRYLGYLISSWAFFLGFLLILLDPQRQGLHDKIARTLVVQE